MPIDMRSDTVTKPTEAMIKAMANAEVGDDVFREDPTVNRLEQMAAERLGKEAALFVTSGTQGNQVAVLTHCHNGDEVILEAESHLFVFEGGALAALAGVQTRTLTGVRGALLPEQVERAIRKKDIHNPRTTLICLENTHNRAGGAIITPEQMAAVYQVARTYGIPLHLDGARLFHSAVALRQDVQVFTQYADTVQICLSKGLSAPVGSLLAGPRDYIEEARWWRKKLGGGMRQAGYMAAAGIVALTEMVERLDEDHAHAAMLEKGLLQLSFDVRPVETNIILLDTKRSGFTAEQLIEKWEQKGLYALEFGKYVIRLVVHRHIGEQDVKRALSIIESVLVHQESTN